MLTFTIIMIGALAFLSIIEIVRYRTAADDEIPYPRRRLISRLSISGVFIVVLTAMAFDDKHPMPPMIRLIYLGVVVLLTLFGFFLILRELTATSRAVVHESRTLDHTAAKSVVQMIEEAKKNNGMKTDKENPKT